MELYMKVMLKEEYLNEAFIVALNDTLCSYYGASNPNELFNCWQTLIELANFVNANDQSSQQYRRKSKPVTPQELTEKIAALKYGYYQLQLNAPLALDDCLDAIAISKWIDATGAKYIDTEASQYYDPKIVRDHTDPVLAELGHDLRKVWK
jgi:hypothetical protein